MSYEVEQKFPLPDPAEALARLAALGATPGRAEDQVDAYYAHPARDFAQTDEALRIRRVGERSAFTYKGPKLDLQTKTRREIELPIAPGPNASEDASQLLLALGFRLVREVRKTRRRLDIAWRGASVTGALDEIATLGVFLELEIVTDEAGLATAREQILSLAAELGLGPSERRSYLELLLAKSPPG